MGPPLLTTLVSDSREQGKSGISDTSEYFSTDGLSDDLKGRSVRGGVVMIGSQAVRFFLQLGSMAVLARLLSPADFGLIAMVTAVVGFVAMFKDVGLSMATVQRAEINHDQISTLFWFNVSLSIALMVLVAAIAPGIAWFYGEPRLVGITLVIATGFIFGGFTIQHQALLRRQMRFVPLSATQVLSQVTGVVTAVVLALLGAGYWALAATWPANATMNAVLVWIFCRWRPGRPRRGTGVKQMLRFGGNLTGFNFVNYFSRNFDNILIGWAWGAGLLGFYTKAYGLLMLPIQQINAPFGAVAIPSLSALQKDPERYRRYYRRAIEIISFLGMPVVVLLFLAADEVIITVLGSQWKESVPIFRALGPAAFMGTTNVATGWVYITSGQTARQLRWGLFGSLILCLSMTAGLPWGSLGVALAVSISRCLLKVPGLWYSYQGTHIRLNDFWMATWRPTLASLSAGILAHRAEIFLLESIETSGIRLLIILLTYVIFYATVFSLLPHGFRRLVDIIAAAQYLRPERV